LSNEVRVISCSVLVARHPSASEKQPQRHPESH
jgi:hypothetical protein